MKFLLLLPLILVANFGFSSAQDGPYDRNPAERIADVFLKNLQRNAVNGNVFEFLKMVVPEDGENLDAGSIFAGLKEYTFAVLSASLTDLHRQRIEALVNFFNPNTDNLSMNFIVVIERDGNDGMLKLRSIKPSKSYRRKSMMPPLVMG